MEGDRGGGGPREEGVGGVREAGEEGAGGVREAGEEGRKVGFPRWQDVGEKGKKITQHFAMFRNRKNSTRREPTNTGRELGLKSTGGGRLKPPCPLPGEMHACSLPLYCFLRQKTLKLYCTSVGCNSLFCFTLGY